MERARMATHRPPFKGRDERAGLGFVLVANRMPCGWPPLRAPWLDRDHVGREPLDADCRAHFEARCPA